MINISKTGKTTIIFGATILVGFLDGITIITITWTWIWIIIVIITKTMIGIIGNGTLVTNVMVVLANGEVSIGEISTGEISIGPRVCGRIISGI